MFLNWKRSSLYWHARVRYVSREAGYSFGVKPSQCLDARVEAGLLGLHAHAETGERLPLPGACPPISAGDHDSVKEYADSLSAMEAFEIMVDALAEQYYVREEQL